MDPKRIDTGGHDRIGHSVESRLRILFVDADAAFDGDRNGNRILHGPDTVCNQFRFLHQAGAETTRLNPVGRTADVDVDLIVAERLDDLRRPCHVRGIGAAELAGNGMFQIGKSEQALPIAMDHGPGGYHFGIKQRVPAQLPVKRPAMTIRPVHHGRDGEFMCLVSIHTLTLRAFGQIISGVLARLVAYLIILCVEIHG